MTIEDQNLISFSIRGLLKGIYIYMTFGVLSITLFLTCVMSVPKDW